jgi:hypothetical protein
MATRINKKSGTDSFGSLPLWMIRGITQSTRRIKKGRMERGATRAPVREENNGKVVMGRQIRAIAQSTSQIISTYAPIFPGVFISKESCQQFLSFIPN